MKKLINTALEFIGGLMIFTSWFYVPWIYYFLTGEFLDFGSGQ